MASRCYNFQPPQIDAPNGINVLDKIARQTRIVLCTITLAKLLHHCVIWLQEDSGWSDRFFSSMLQGRLLVHVCRIIPTHFFFGPEISWAETFLKFFKRKKIAVTNLPQLKKPGLDKNSFSSQRMSCSRCTVPKTFYDPKNVLPFCVSKPQEQCSVVDMPVDHWTNRSVLTCDQRKKKQEQMFRSITSRIFLWSRHQPCQLCRQ